MENLKLSKVISVGNSLAVTIPVAILRGLDIKRGDQVVFGVYSADTFAVRKISPNELQKLKPGEVEF